MVILQLGAAFRRLNIRYGRLLLLTCFLGLVNVHALEAQVRAIRITFNTNTGNQALSGWNSSAYQSFSGVGSPCLLTATGPSELQFWGWGTSSSAQHTDVEHVAGTSAGTRPDYTRFDSVAPGVYQLEMNFNTFFGDPYALPKSSASCLPGSPGLLTFDDTLRSISFKIRGDSVSTAFLNTQCGAIPDCDCSPACLNNMTTSAYHEPAIGGYYVLRDLQTNNPILLDTAGTIIPRTQVRVEVIHAHDLQLTAISQPEPQYYAKPILHAGPLKLQVKAENYGYQSIKGIEVKALVYDPQDRLIFTSTQTIDDLHPFQATYTGKTAGEETDVFFPQTFLPKTTGRYTVVYEGTTISVDDNTLNNRLTQYFEITDSTFARDNGNLSGWFTLPPNFPFNVTGAIGQTYELQKADSLTSITVKMDLRNHLPSLGYPTLTAGLYTWDAINQRPGALVDTSFSYQLTPSDVGKLIDKTFTLSKGPIKLAPAKYVIAIHQYGAKYQVLFVYADGIYEGGSTWQSSGTYPPLPASWQEVSVIQGAFHLRPNFGTSDCISMATDSTGAAIQQVLLQGESSTLNHTSSGTGGVYHSFYGNTADVIPQNRYHLQVVLSDSGSGPFVDRRVAAFVDWNGDFDFDDAGESIGEVGPISGGMPAPINTLSFQVPSFATEGTRKLRLVCVEGAAAGSISACGKYARGETEDYVIQVVPYVNSGQGYCEASAILYDDLSITKVVLIGEQSSINLAINSPQVGTRYSDFTSQQVTLKRNTNYNLSLNIEDAQDGYQSQDKNRGFKVFIDWNQDEVFDPVSELVATALRFNFNGPGPVNMTIQVPSTAKSGKTRMRIIAQRTSALADIYPCGFFDKGEVEDYSIFVPSDQVPFNSLPPISNPGYHIESVSLVGESLNIQKASSCSGSSPAPAYQDFRSNLANLIPDQSYQMHVVFDTCSFPSTLDSGKVFVYADWNKDGDIEDFNETLYELPFIDGISPDFDLKGKLIPIEIHVPAETEPGFLSLFVEVASIKASGKITNEVEEYTLVILSPRDVSISQILASSEACGMAQTAFGVEICNLGQETLYQIPVEVQIGSSTYNLTFSDTLNPNSCATLAIDTLDVRGGAIWNIQAQTLLTGDTDLSNDYKALSVSFGEVPQLDVDTIHLCQLDTAFLPLTSGNATYFWYDTISGGSAIDTGTYIVPTSLTQPITYYVQGEAFSHDSLDNWYPDSVGYFAELTQQGNLADITAKTSLSIDAFDLNLFINAGVDTAVTIYYKSGSYHGFERDPSAWQTLGPFQLTSNGQDNKTRLTLPEPLTIPAGQTVGLYIVGPLANAIFLPFLTKDFLTEENNDLITESGLTSCSPMPMVNGCLFGIRYWSTVIHYTKGCASERLPITLTFDQLPPTALCKTATVSLDSTGLATVAISDINAGSSDNCSLQTLAISQDSFFCSEVGAVNVSLTATDSRNNSSSCQATVEVKDPFSPVALCQDATLSLDVHGDAILTGNMVDAGSSDNCAISSLSVLPNNFSCIDIGTSTITLWVSDTDGNLAACQAQVTIQDDLPPDAICQDITLMLDAAGNAFLAASQIDGGSSDNCTALTVTISQDSFSCNELGANTVSLHAFDGFGNSNMCQAQVTIKDEIVPTAACQPITLFLDATGAAHLSANQVDAGSQDNCLLDTLTLAKTAFSCSDVGTNPILLTATDQSNNTSTCQVMVTLIDTFPPVMSCQSATITLDINGEIILSANLVKGSSADLCGNSLFFLSKTNFTCADMGANQVTLIGVDGSGNIDSCQTNVTIQDNMPPDARCQDVSLILDANGNASLAVSQINAGSSDNCAISTLSLSKNSFSCGDLGNNALTLLTTDVNGNSNSCQANAMVSDTTPPTALCQPITLFLQATGNASLSPSQLDAGSQDNCTVDELLLSKNAFTCSDVGTNAVTLSVADQSGNTTPCQSLVTIADTIPPTMNCQHLTLSLDANGEATLAPSQVSAGSADACGIQSLTLSQTAFTCSDIGNSTVTLIAEDIYANQATCQATITIQDDLVPFAACQDISINLDANGNATLSSSQINAGSSDNCGINSQLISQSSFDCNHLGANTISLSLTDGYNNSNTCQASVTIIDNVAPHALCQAVTLNLDVSGNAFLTTSQIDNGSNDNCMMDTLSLMQNTFTCSDIGTQQIVLTATDQSSNTATCQASVSVLDTIPPVMNCQDVTLTLDANGQASLTSAQVDNGSDDACGISSLTLNLISFSCSDIGTTTVTLFGEDIHSNSAFCQASITVQDISTPTALCQNLSLNLNATGTATLAPSQVNAGSIDNCTITSLSILQNSFSCNDLGSNLVTLSVSDASNNTNTCQAQILIADATPPTMLCQPVTLTLDPQGNASLTAAQVNGGSQDNCMIDTLMLNQYTFDCSNLGTNSITLTAIDPSNNSASCQANVSIQDVFDPVMNCQNTTLSLGANGTVALQPQQLDGGSIDNCGIDSLEVNIQSFTCSDIGSNLVRLKAFDASGNHDTCQATVIVQDDLPPDMNCQASVTLTLNTAGNASLFINQVDAGTMDNCMLDSLSLSQTTFDSLDTYFVYLRGVDIYGNEDSCLTIVTVQDTAAPVMVCQSVILDLDAQGIATLAPSDVDNGSSDRSGSLSLSIDKSNFSCLDVGVNQVTLTGVSINQLTAFCLANVTVRDTLIPTISCQTASIALDNQGLASLATSQVDAGHQDNCGAVTLQLSQDTFDCSHVGSHTVTLFAEDVNGNISSCTANITVSDAIPPAATCQSITLQLNASGTATVSINQIDNGSSDNCGIAFSGLSKSAFSCTDLGVNNVFLAVIDNNGINGTCQATVTVEDTISPVMVCQPTILFLDAFGFATLHPTQVDGGSDDNCAINTLSVDKSSFDCFQIGSQTIVLTGTDNSNNPASCTTSISIQDSTPPTMVCQPVDVYLDANGSTTLSTSQVDGGSSDVCGIAFITINITSFDCSDIGANTVTLSATDVNANLADCQATITVHDTLPPVMFCQDVTISLDNTSTVTLTANQLAAGSSDNCGAFTKGLSQSVFTFTDFGTNAILVTGTDPQNNAATCISQVTVLDTTPPVMVCQATTLSLDINGNATLTPAQVDNGSSDLYGITSFSLSEDMFDCQHIGQNTVTLTGTNANGYYASCMAAVQVIDSLSPTMVCQAVNVDLGSQGTGTLTPGEVDGGTVDNCGNVTLGINRTQFSCADISSNIVVTLTATDAEGNSANCTANVNVRDVMPPDMSCRAVTLPLDPNGNTNLNTSQINNGSSDNCGISLLALSKSNFTCADKGANLITLIAIDFYGNSSTCQAQVSVQDLSPPVMNCQDITLTLDANGLATLSTNQVNAGSQDNCGITSLSINKNSFTCSDVGQQTVTLEGIDASFNHADCQATVTIQDTTPPVAICSSITLALDINGEASLAVSQINSGSNDICGVASTSISQTQFTCSDIGSNGIFLTVTDHHNNSTTCQANVQVEDLLDPAVQCQPVTLYLDSTGSVSLATNQVNAGSSDNCGVVLLGLSKSNFGISDLGVNSVTLTGSDTQGNSTFCNTTVTVLDTFPPIMKCQDVTLFLDQNGSASLTATQIDAGSSDKLGISSLTIDKNQFTCLDVGQNTVVLTATNSNTLSASCHALVTVIDSLLPTVGCQHLTLSLDINGSVNLAVSEVSTGVQDNCGIASVSLDQNQFGCSDTGSQIITLTATDEHGNTATCNATVTIRDSDAPIMNCQSPTLFIDANGGVQLAVNQINMGSTDNCGIVKWQVTQDSFSCNDIGQLMVTLTAEDGSGNAAMCQATVNVRDTLPPVMNCKTATLILDANGMATLALAQVDAGITDNCGLDSSFVSKSNFGVGDLGQNPVTLTAIDMYGNVDSCQTIVNVQDSTAPTMICRDITLALDANGSASIAVSDIDGGSSDIAGFVSLTISDSSFSCMDVGQILVSLAGLNTRGISATCQAQVRVTDQIPPTMSCQPITLNLNNSGLASLTTNQVDAGSFDNCGINALTLSQDSFDCADIGQINISLTGTDESGNTAICQTTLTLRDVSDPNMSCQAVTLPLDSSGNASLAVQQMDAGSQDNCAIQTYTLSQSQFSCNDIGQNTITLTASDASNNTASCQANVNVQDNQAPVMHCQNLSLTLNANGNTSLTVNQIDIGSSDNCGINSFTLSKNTFTCSDVGQNLISLTANDAHGNSNACQVTVTIQDSLLPQMACLSPTLYLDQNGNASLMTAQIDAGSSDNCGITSLTISKQSFNCLDVGQQGVTLSGSDPTGNNASCQATVTIQDSLPPSVMCQSVILILDSLGNANLAVSQVNTGSSDNCGIATTSLSQTNFTIADLGQNTITLSVTDIHGNTNSCTATITVQDLSLPVMSCQNNTVYLDANGQTSLAVSDIDAGSSDSQGLVSLTVSPNQFSCADLGQLIVTLTGTNVAGNNASCFAIASIADTIPPQVSCQSAILSLDANGIALLPVTFIDAGSGDNCQIGSMVVTPNNFTCNDIGTNTVTLTATDDSGNASSCTATAQVRDPVAPNSLCQPATLYLNNNGAATLSAPQINAGSNDNCGISIVALSKSSFTCADEGPNMVTLITIDGNGNSSTCQALVTVLDTISPTVQCKADTLILDANSLAFLTSSQISAGANDNCSIDSLSVSQRIFTTTHVGQNMVYLIATDIHGNQDSCLADVTVMDTTGPAMQCQAVVLSLDAQGLASLSPNQIDAGSSDQYGAVSLSVSPDIFSCASKGPSTVTLTGINVNGVPASCQTTVTIQDMLPPTMLCQNATLPLGPNGTGTLTVSQVDAGSFDNCGIASYALSKSNYTCADIGTNNVTFAATDSSSNFSTCQATVTVVDALIPVAACQNLTLPLNANGTVSLTPAQVDAGSTDNCTLTPLISHTSFDCSDVGMQSVILLVTDAGSNTASCQANVLVEDTTAPALSCQNVLLPLGPQGHSILTVNQVALSSNDNCGIQSLVLSKDSFVCADIGTQIITLTATDAANNQTSCQSTVRIIDSSAPTMACQPTTVYLDATGQGILTAAQVDAGSTDNCGISTLFVGQNNFACADMGVHSVPLAGVDGSGNSDGCLATVTVVDTLPPMALCEPAILTLNANGHASLSLAQVNAGSTDNCGIQSLTLNKTTFTCIDAGLQMVTLTATDSSGNQHSCTASVTVLDTTSAPSITAVGDTAFCEGDQVTLKAPPGFLAYEWSNGRTDSQIVVTLSDTLTVRVAYATGCWTPFSISQIVLVDPAIPSPQIMKIGMDSLQCSIPNGDDYVWFRNDTLLAATTRTIFAPQNGEYKVFVNRGLCTSDTSVIFLINTGLPYPASSPALTLYPNPNRGIFFLRGDFGTSSLVEVHVFSIDGKRVFERETFAPGGKLDELLSLRDVADGVYLVRVRVNMRYYYEKVEVVR